MTDGFHEALARWPSRMSQKKLSYALEYARSSGAVDGQMLLVGHAATFEGPGRIRASSPFFVVETAGTVVILFTRGLISRTHDQFVLGPGTTTPFDAVDVQDDALSWREGADRDRPGSGIEHSVGKFNVSLLDRGAVVGRLVFPYTKDPRMRQLARDEANVFAGSINHTLSGGGSAPVASAPEPVLPAVDVRPEQVAPVPDTDWADPEAVLAEWRNDDEPPNMGNAMEMYDAGLRPEQWFVISEYMTRVLKMVLLDQSLASSPQAIELCRRILLLMGQTPPADMNPIFRDMHMQQGPRHIRLALAVIRANGWQPTEYGGDGSIGVDLDRAPIVAAVATTKGRSGNSLQYFFGR